MARRTPVTRVRIALAVGAAAMSALLISSASAVSGEVADGAVAQATPTITASPSTDLAAGQTVTITGSGFTPNQSIGVSQCEDPFVDSSSCDFATAKIANSDGSGGFTMSYTVVDTIKGTHSCVPTGCLLGAANLNTANEFGNRVSLTFADGSTPPTTDGSTPTTTPPGTDPDGSDDADIAGADGTSSALAKTGASDMLPYLVAGGVLLVAAGVVVTRRARSASR